MVSPKLGCDVVYLGTWGRGSVEGGAASCIVPNDCVLILAQVCFAHQCNESEALPVQAKYCTGIEAREWVVPENKSGVEGDTAANRLELQLRNHPWQSEKFGATSAGCCRSHCFKTS